MAEPFNPYASWLHIETDEPTPNYYLLLGVPYSCSDEAEIKHAADAQMARVRAIRPGEHARDWSQVLDEIRQAKTTLLDADKRAAYDQQLQDGPAVLDGDETRPADGSMASTAASSIIADAAPSNIGTTDDIADEAPQPVAAPVHNPMPPGFGPPPASVPEVPAPTAPVESEPAAPAELGPAKRPAPPSTPGAPTTVPQTMAGSPQNPAAPVGNPAVPTGQPIAQQPIAQQQPGIPTAGPVAMPIAGAPLAGVPVAGPIAGTPTAGPIAGNPATPVAGEPFAGSPTGSPLGGAPLAGVPIAGVPIAGAPMAGAPVAGIPVAGPVVPGATAPDIAQPVAGPTLGATAPLGTAEPTATTVGASAESGVGVVADEKSMAERAGENKKNLVPYLLALAVCIPLLLGGAYMFGLFGGGGEDPEVAAGENNGNGEKTGTGGSGTGDGGTGGGGTETGGGGGSNILGPGETITIGPGPGPGPVIPIGPTPVDPLPIPVDPGPAGPVDPTPGPVDPPVPVDPPTDPTPPEMSAEDQAAVLAALEAARKALGRREFDVADQQLAAAMAKSPAGELLKKVQRADTLRKYVVEFWDVVEKEMINVDGREVEIDGNPAFVVEANADTMVIRHLGQNLTFSKDTLPPKLVRMLANRWFDQDDPSSKVFMGAYLAVDPQGDPEEARQLWQEAAAANVPVSNLLPVLDDQY